MATFITQQQGVFGKAIYVAVPLRPTLVDILNASEFKDDAFSLPMAPPHIEGRRILIEVDGSLVELTTTFSREKGDISQLYTLPSDGLDGYTTLNVSVTGKASSSVDKVIQKFLSFFGRHIDLEMKPDVKQIYDEGFRRLVKEISHSFSFLDKYQKIKAKLSDVKKLPPKKIERGIFADMGNEYLSKLGVTNFQSAYNVMLVNRIEGRYNPRCELNHESGHEEIKHEIEYEEKCGEGHKEKGEERDEKRSGSRQNIHNEQKRQDMLVELSLLHFGGRRINPQVWGVFIYKKHKEGCPNWEVPTCEQSESYAGHFLTPEKIVFGGSLLLPEYASRTYRDQESGPTSQKDFCLRAIHLASANEAFDKIEESLSHLSRPLTPTKTGIYDVDKKRYNGNAPDIQKQFAQEQFDDIRTLTRLVYDTK